VHPEDPRYQHLIGKHVLHPFADRRLPIVGDSVTVDMTFGTGAVKITPAHDANDYECGKRNNLPFLTIFTDEGLVSPGCGQFSGMKRFEARKAVLAELTALGLYRETKENPMVVPVCSRSKDIVEPIIKPQWYVQCADMAKQAMEAVGSGELTIIPESHKKTWSYWMEGMRDWCISRQLWWGHRIPAYQVTIAGTPAGEDLWVSGRTEEEARAKAAAKHQVSEDRVSLKQDPDVLDTWFSSGLFPFSVLGWPEKTDDLAVFFPGSLLETGHDIIFFWVARMVFFAQKLLGSVPFKDVFLHAMVRDAHGRKMSKSLGNTINPNDVIRGVSLEELHRALEEGNLDPREVAKAKAGQAADYPQGIPECGTDALRFGLCAYTAQGRDINLDVLRVQGYRFFCNKLWNATKFALNYLGCGFQPEVGLVARLQGRSRAAQGSIKVLGHTPLPEHLTAPSSLATLNSLLMAQDHLSGALPTSTDATAFAALPAAPDYFALPGLARWWHRMNALPAGERGGLPAGAGLSLPSPAPLQPMDRWILSRLAAALEDVLRGFAEYNFPLATTALYNFWLYELCDVYLEVLKPVFQGTDAGAILTARNVLYLCLDSGLRLISPFMPFISEELFQRLPRWSAQEPPSITVTRLPTPEDTKFRDTAIEAEVATVQKLVSVVRSTRADYTIPNKTKTELFLQSFDPALSATLQQYCGTIGTLAYSKDVRVTSAPPPGCAILTVSDKLSAHLLLKGLIEPAKEVEKLEKKKTALATTIEKLKKAAAVADYTAKVPEEVRAANQEKLAGSEVEVVRLGEAILALQAMEL